MRTKIKRALLLSVITGIGVGFAAQAADTTYPATSTSRSTTGTTSTTGATKADHKTVSFLKDAARGNDQEIAVAEVGIQKAQNAELKSFCEMLQKDHTQAKQQLDPLAQKYGVALEDLSKRKETREVNKFEKETGAKFDQEFAKAMLKDHEKDIREYQKAAKDLETPDVKQFAESMLPKLREHFQHAETVAKAVGVDEATISSYSKKVGEAMGGTGSDTSSSSGSSLINTNTSRDRLHDLRSGNAVPPTGTSPAVPDTTPR